LTASFAFLKLATLGLFLSLLLMAVTCRPGTARLQMLQQTWLHSHEEDQGEIFTYRPNTYDFPPSRGRTGFSLNEGGKFVQYEIAPTDGLEERTGRWTMTGRDEIRVIFDEERHQDFILEIVHMEPELLRVRRKLPE
jgi:hypothetical protein